MRRTLVPPEKPRRKRLVLPSGGFAGVYAAHHLERLQSVFAGYEVFLSRNPQGCLKKFCGNKHDGRMVSIIRQMSLASKQT